MAVEKIILDIRAQVDKAKQDIDSLKNKTKGLNKEVNQTAKLMKKAATAMAAFVSIGVITRAIGNMVKLNIEFEKTLTNVMTLLDKATKAKFGDFLSAGALRTMSTFGLQVGDVNKALFDTISAGIKAGNSIEFLREAAKLAIGGVTDLSTAVDGMTSIMNAYALSIEEANKVASAFFTAQKHGKTTVAELAQNVGMLAPTAKMAGISFQQMLSAMALLTKQGIQTDMASTSLRATIIALTKTTPATAKAFEDMGIKTGITAIKTQGFGETLLQVAKAAEENEDILTVLIPSVRALTAVAALGTEALVEYDKILEDVNTNYGEGSDLVKAHAEQMNTLRKRIDEAKGAIQEFVITLRPEDEEGRWGLRGFLAGTANMFRKMTDAITWTTKEYEKLGDSVEGTNEAFDIFAVKTKAVTEEQRLLNEETDKALATVKAKKALEEISEAQEEFIKNLKTISDAQAGFAKSDQEAYDEVMERIHSDGDERKEYSKKINDEILFDLKESLNDQIKALKKKTDAEKTAADLSLELELTKQQNTISIVQGTAGLLRGLAGENFLVQQLVAIAESIVSTFLSGQLAYASMIGIPIVGPALAAAAKKSAIIQGLANTAIIAGVTIAGFEEGGFTGKSKYQARDKDGRIAGFVHEDEFVFNRDKTRTLRPLFEDIHNNRIDIHGLAALTRRGTMKMMPKLNADILEQEVKKIYRKMSEEQTEKPVIIHHSNGYTKTIGNTTINVST